MLHYTFSYHQPESHFVTIRFRVPTSDLNEVLVQLPSWRPGRYELANYAKNIRSWKVTDGNENALTYQKVTKDSWNISCAGASTVEIEYTYYANQLDAGASYLDAQQLYINPVNCCLFVPSMPEAKCTVQLELPEDYKVATGMAPQGNNTFEAANFQVLADSPFIASAGLQHRAFEMEGTTFHIWFQGEVKPDWDRILKDFKGYTAPQIELFGDFPVEEYHYYYQIAPYRLYHGVEHLDSTVIALGPSYSIMEKTYFDFLGVSSHELFHSWNVKAIRPKAMLPYDFTQENYSSMGYVYEGVTTYYGDLMLWRGDVFDDEQYFKEINNYLMRHVDNFARFNMSVAASSLDTWLDGYVKGIPNRKVSIYTEGCMLALLADLRIRAATNHSASLDNVMRLLYERFGKEGVGYTEADYKGLLEEVSGQDYTAYFNDFIWGTEDYLPALREVLDHFGCEIISTPATAYSAAHLGFKQMKMKDANTILAIYPNSPADKAGLSIDDKVLAINGYALDNNLDEWCAYFKEEPMVFTVIRAGEQQTIALKTDGKKWYTSETITKKSDINSATTERFSNWKAGKTKEN